MKLLYDEVMDRLKEKLESTKDLKGSKVLQENFFNEFLEEMEEVTDMIEVYFYKPTNKISFCGFLFKNQYHYLFFTFVS